MPRLIAVLVGLALQTCPVTGAWAQPAASPPVGQMTWAVHFTLAPRWLDPAESGGTITPFLTLYAVHDALLKPMPSGPSAPSLAESWSASPSGLVYDFTLRSNARFHNGEPVTAEDVKFSFERYRGANAAVLKEHVQEIRVLDARRIQFHLKDPWADFITFYGTTATSAGWIVPKKYIEQVGEDGFKKAPIGAGPYRVVAFAPGVEITLEAFDGYWRKTPSVKRLIFRSLPDETTRAAALKRGDADVAYFLNGPIAEEVRRTPGLRLMAVRSNTIFFLDFRGQWEAGSPGRDQRVRTAASLAIDRRALNQAEQLGFGGLTGSVVPRGLEFALAIDPDPYDPARAKRLLAEADFPRGVDAGDFTIAPPYDGAGEAIANYLAAVGIRLKIRTMERAAFLSALARGQVEGPGLRRARTRWQRGHSPADPGRQRRAIRGGRAARGAGPVRAAGPRARPQEARGDAPRDPAHPQRPEDFRAHLGERLHPRRRTARRGSGPLPDSLLPLFGPVRGRPAQAMTRGDRHAL